MLRPEKLMQQSPFLAMAMLEQPLGILLARRKCTDRRCTLFFPKGKDNLFQAVLPRLVEEEIERYKKETSNLKTLRKKLLYCVEQWSMGGFRLTETHPDAGDEFNMAHPAVRKMYGVLTTFYAELLQDAVAESPLQMSAEQVAFLLIFSLRGIKDIAEDAESMRRLLVQEVDLFLAALSA